MYRRNVHRFLDGELRRENIMTKQEFDAIVDDAVKNGTPRKDAEAFVVAGFHLDGIPASERQLGDGKKTPVKKTTKKK